MRNKNVKKYDPDNIAVKDINFNLMYKIWLHPLCRYAERFVNQDGEDIVQELFRVLWEKRETLFITEKLSSYLYKSVRNIRNNYLAVKEKSLKYFEHVQYMHDAGDCAYIQDNSDLETMFIISETVKKIDNAIANLPENCRKVFNLVWKEELKYSEVAEKLGITVGTVGAQMNRAKKKMQQLFEN